MKIKKIPKILALSLLTGGASLIVGLLSFSGMFALWPCLLLAGGSFALAVAFEGEVYYQNIKSAFQKLFKPDYFAYESAKEYLRTYFPKKSRRPQFFQDYEEKLLALHQFNHKECDIEEEIEKEALNKELKEMEQWFSIEFFDKNTKDLSPYQQELRTWLSKNEQSDWQEKFKNTQIKYRWAAVLSGFAGIFMCFGSSYLLLEAFAVIPVTAAITVTFWPMLIVPMAFIAGTAYGLLTYNAFTDMISKNTLESWRERFTQYLNKKWSEWKPGAITTAVAELVLLSLIVSLTFCTAGTWRTIARQTPPLFAWMSRMPKFIMGVLNPFITSITTLAFNIQNTSETLELFEKANRYILRSLPGLPTAQKNNLYGREWRNTYVYAELFQQLYYITEEGALEVVTVVDEALKVVLENMLKNKKVAHITMDEIHEFFKGHAPKGNIFSRFVQSYKDSYSEWAAIENPWHRWNPFRILINLTYEPLHHTLFVGHLTSSSVTADRVENIPELASAVVGFACDGLVDGHYFIRHAHEHHDHSIEALLEERLGQNADHDHNNDFPTFLLKLGFFPICVLAEGWDWCAEKISKRKPFSFISIWNKWMNANQSAMSEHSHIQVDSKKVSSKGTMKHAWFMERTIHRLRQYKEKHLKQVFVGQEIAKEKMEHLTRLEEELRVQAINKNVNNIIQRTVKAHLNNSEHSAIYNKSRFFPYGKTSTEQFLEEELMFGTNVKAG